MQIIPAIDIRGGNCVMLTQGKLGEETIYSKEPVFIAKVFQAKGARRIHIVDLDGAFVGVPQNLKILKQIRKEVNVELQFGGGVRDLKTARKILKLGIDRVIIGTLAVYNPEVVKKMVKEFVDKLIVAIDVKDGKVAVGGWKDVSSIDAGELVKKMEGYGIKEIIITDIMKDGTMEGPNIEGVKKIAQSSGLDIILSGGVSSPDDIKNIITAKIPNLSGIIIGKALYTDDIKFEDAIKVAHK